MFVDAGWVQFCVYCCRLGTVLYLLHQVGYSFVFVAAGWVTFWFIAVGWEQFCVC